MTSEEAKAAALVELVEACDAWRRAGIEHEQAFKRGSSQVGVLFSELRFRECALSAAIVRYHEAR